MGRLQQPRRSASAPQARVLRLLSAESERSGALTLCHAKAGSALEAVDGTSEKGRAPRERAVSLAQCASIGHEPTSPSTAERARAASALAAPPASGERAQSRVRVCAHANAGCSLEAVDGTSEQGRAPKERAVSLAQWASMKLETTPTSAARRARVSKAHVLCLLPTESQRSSAIALCHTKADCALETAAGHSEHGLAPRGRGFSLL